MQIRIAPETPHNFTVEASPMELKALNAKVPGASMSRHGLLFIPINPASVHELLLAVKAADFEPGTLKVALEIESLTKAFQRAQTEAIRQDQLIHLKRDLMPHQS